MQDKLKEIKKDKTNIFSDCSVIDKFSTAQKMLNVMCKYWWAAGIIDEPPHCPIDRQMYDKLDKDNKKIIKDYLNGKEFAWTKDLNDGAKHYKGSCYGAVMDVFKNAANNCAKKLSVAEWECNLWNSEDDEND